MPQRDTTVSSGAQEASGQQQQQVMVVYVRSLKTPMLYPVAPDSSSMVVTCPVELPQIPQAAEPF